MRRLGTHEPVLLHDPRDGRLGAEMEIRSPSKSTHALFICWWLKRSQIVSGINSLILLHPQYPEIGH